MLTWPQRQSGSVRQTRCSIVANMYKIVDDPAAIIPSIPKLKPLIRAACGKIYKLHDGHLFWYKQQRSCTFTYKRLRVVAEIGSLHFFVLNVESPSWSHGDTSTLFQLVRGAHRCTATFNVIVSLLVWFIQTLSIRKYMKSLTYKRAPLGDGGTSGPRLAWTPHCRLCHLCEDGGNLRYWALVGYTPRGQQVVQCSGWRQRCGLDRVDDCSHGRQQGVDLRHEAHEPRDLFTRCCSIHQRAYLVPKELDEKVTIAALQFERQARDRASSPRPSRRVLRGPRRRSPSLLRYTVSQASKVERIGSRFLELVCSLPNVSTSAPCRRGDCRV